VPPNQEMIAQGASNILGSFFSCLPMSGSLSRSLVQEASGCKTQLTSLISAMLLLSVLLFLGPYFKPLPVCVLAAIILASLTGIMKKVADIHKFWSRSKVDGLVWVVTFLSTVFLDVGLGLLTGVVVNLVIVLAKANIPTVAVMQKDEEGQVWLDRARYKVARRKDNLVLTIRGPLNFLTVGFVQILIENEVNSTTKISCKKTIEREKSVTSIVKVSTGDQDDKFDSEDEMIPDKLEKSKFVILDLSFVTSLDSKGCSLVPWLEYKVKEEGGWLVLVMEGKVEEVMDRSGVLDDLDCEVFPTVFDAEELGKTEINQKRNL
jgi:MFS superfamily sulfate permease-like transporter